MRLDADFHKCHDLYEFLPNGVSGVDCEGSQCIGICEIGTVSVGPMKIKCKESKNRGLFWNKVRKIGMLTRLLGIL